MTQQLPFGFQNIYLQNDFKYVCTLSEKYILRIFRILQVKYLICNLATIFLSVKLYLKILPNY